MCFFFFTNSSNSDYTILVCSKQGPNSPTIFKNVLSLVIQSFLYWDASESNTTLHLLNLTYSLAKEFVLLFKFTKS